MPQFDPSHFTHNYSGNIKRNQMSHPLPVYLSRQTPNHQETKKIQSKILNVKKAVLPGPVMKTEEERMMKWKVKKYSNELSTIIEERKKELKDKDLS
jgi:hypothetical protein